MLYRIGRHEDGESIDAVPHFHPVIGFMGRHLHLVQYLIVPIDILSRYYWHAIVPKAPFLSMIDVLMLYGFTFRLSLKGLLGRVDFDFMLVLINWLYFVWDIGTFYSREYLSRLKLFQDCCLL